MGDGLSRADRLVPEAPARHRRQRSGEHGGEERSQRGQRGRGGDDRGQGAADEQTSRRRRRRSGAGAGADSTRDNRGSAEATEGQAPSRRRRRHLSSEERDDAFRAAAARERPLLHRRKTALPAAPVAVASTSASQSGQPTGERFAEQAAGAFCGRSGGFGRGQGHASPSWRWRGSACAEHGAGASAADDQAPRPAHRRSRKPRGGADGADNTPSAE